MGLIDVIKSIGLQHPRNFNPSPNLNPNPGPSHEPYAQQVAAQAVDFLYRGLPRVAGTVLVPIATIWIMWGYIAHTILISWSVAMLLTSIAIQLLSAIYLRRARSVEETPRWGRYMTLGLFANGLLWGIASHLFFVADSAPLQVFLFTSIIGLCAGSVSLLAYWLESYYAFIVPALSLSALRLFLEGRIEYQMEYGN